MEGTLNYELQLLGEIKPKKPMRTLEKLLIDFKESA